MKHKNVPRMVKCMSDHDGFTYLAAPYSHPDQAVRDWRVSQILIATANLLNKGELVFSPIGHTYELERLVKPELSNDHSFWMRLDITVLRHAHSLTVLTLPGWTESRGVRQEIALAKACGMPVRYIDVNGHADNLATYFAYGEAT